MCIYILRPYIYIHTYISAYINIHYIYTFIYIYVCVCLCVDVCVCVYMYVYICVCRYTHKDLHFFYKLGKYMLIYTQNKLLCAYVNTLNRFA